MPKSVGNYIQRDYHNRFSSKRASKWKSYNSSWANRRSDAIQKGQALRATLTQTVSRATTNLVQQQASLALRNSYSPQGTYASPTAVAARVNVLA